MTKCRHSIAIYAFAAQLICGSLTALESHGASFDCAKATLYAEKAICEDPALSDLDDALFDSYQAASADSAGAARKRLKLEQRRWLKQRNSCRSPDCVSKAYEMRLVDLGLYSSDCSLTRCTLFALAGPNRGLWEAVKNGDVVGVKAAISKGASPNACGSNWDRPLHAAVEQQHPVLVSTLLNLGAKPNFRDCAGFTPLALAVGNNDTAMVAQLLAAGADIELGDGTPLELAASHGRVEILKSLLAHGANPNAIRRSSTPLLVAARGGHVEAVHHLLSAGANPNFGLGFGTTPLFAAVGEGSVPPSPDRQEQGLLIAKLLVQHGANVNHESGGVRLLEKAQMLNERAIAEYLTEVGAKP